GVRGVRAGVTTAFTDGRRRIELTRSGVAVTLPPAERDGLGSLVEQLVQKGSSPAKVAEAIRRYLEAVQTRRPPAKALAADGGGPTAAHAQALAARRAPHPTPAPSTPPPPPRPGH